MAKTENGSSPHTWGIRRIKNTGFQAITVHPHIRGAYALLPSTGVKENRFIPTYVGHTDLLHSVHRNFSGSSQHTWGIPTEGSVSQGPCRFIPTYVGHTAQDVYPDEAKSVHPHIRGAYTLQVHSRWTYFGSSPHTWGIQGFRRCGRKNGRFIPTYVGHT